ncbi:TPA: glycosyltransferase family 4 protein, partial [Escherichia coli]|nr:glycosyltransferase family 4 protein [Escherichia coli]
QGKIKNKVFHSSYYRLPQDKGIPVVTTVHDFTYEKYISGPPKWVHSWQKYKAIKHSELLICVSNNTAKDLMEYCGVDEKKIRVIHNGVSEIYRPLGDYQRDNSIVFIGARGGYKNFDVAVRALKHLSDFRMVIVGGGVLNNDEITLLEHNIPGRYEWLGRLTDEELNLQYNKAYCLIYPSSYEGFGIPIIEAMRAGCPVIAINNSSIPEVAGDAAILIEYAEAELVVEAVQSLHTDYNKLRLAGLSQASHFSWDKCYSATKKIYKELS